MRFYARLAAATLAVASWSTAANGQQPSDPTPPTGDTQPPANPNPPNPPTDPANPQPPSSVPPGPDPWGGMKAGGLSPPAPLSTATTESSTTKSELPPPKTDVRDDLDDAKKKDSGRGLSWFWLEVQGGFEHVGLQTFNIDEENFSAGLVQTEASGGALSAGIGAQLVFVTIGARGRLGFFDAWQIGRVGGELGVRIPIGFVEPRFDLGAGYAALGQFDGVVAESIAIHGFYLRAGAGVDFYPVKYVSLGAHASFDFMGLTRPGLDPTQIQQIVDDPDTGDISAAQQQALALEGSGYGAAFALQGSVGLHF